MPEIRLGRTHVVTIIGELVTAGVSQHVEVDRPRQIRALPDGLHEPIDRIRREWRAALGGEDIAAVRVFLPERCQHAEFVAADKGLGFLILFSTSLFKIPQAFASLGILVTASLVLFHLVVLVQKLFFSWSLPKADRSNERPAT